MRIGLMAGATPTGGIMDVVEFSKDAESRGFDSIWIANIFGLDAISTCAIAGWETDKIEFGTAVTPTYPRHPAAIAQQAITTSVAAGGRFSLGIGLSHQIVIEGMFGMSYDKPAAHMKEYLQILAPLLAGEPVDFEGEQLTGKLGLDIPGAGNVPLIVAALGPAMLKLAGAYSDGTITWMTGPKTIENHILPSISASAKEAGRADPRVICGLPIAVTNDVDSAKETISKQLKMYGMLPSYRAMLDREGVEGPADLSLLGDETAIRAQIQSLRDAGVTDFNAAIMPLADDTTELTLDLLQSELS
jgi:5,10-methylenetetrahydromethanopterin reductase